MGNFKSCGIYFFLYCRNIFFSNWEMDCNNKTTNNTNLRVLVAVLRTFTILTLRNAWPQSQLQLLTKKVKIQFSQRLYLAYSLDRYLLRPLTSRPEMDLTFSHDNIGVTSHSESQRKAGPNPGTVLRVWDIALDKINNFLS